MTVERHDLAPDYSLGRVIHGGWQFSAGHRLSGNVLDFTFVRPECLLIDVEASPYFVFTIGACAAILIVLALLRLLVIQRPIPSLLRSEQRGQLLIGPIQ